MKVLLCLQEQVLLESLSCLLEDVQHVRFQVVAATDDGLEGIDLARRHAPEVALIGMRLLGHNGLEVVRHLQELSPRVPALLLANDVLTDPVAEALAAGAGGCITRDTDTDELVRALMTVASGETYLCSKAAEIMVRAAANGGDEEHDPVYADLTPREREVLQLLAEGWSSRETGERLNISSKTVDTHRRNVMTKLQADSLAELVKHAIRAGLTDLEA